MRIVVFLCLSLFACQQVQENDGSFSDSLVFVPDTLTGNGKVVREAITTYEDPDRKEWQNPALVINKLGELEGRTVADIGAGTGYFSFRLAREGARVLAIDIDPQYLSYIEQRQEELISEAEDNAVETRLSAPDDPLLAPGEADAVLLVNTYTYIDERVDYLGKVYSGMANGGTIAIVDYKNTSNPVANEATIILDPEKVAEELKQAGFTHVVTDTSSLQYQYILTAKKE